MIFCKTYCIPDYNLIHSIQIHKLQNYTSTKYEQRRWFENKCSRNSFAQWGYLMNCFCNKCINMTTHNCLLLHSFFNFHSIFSPFNKTSFLRLYISYLYILPPSLFQNYFFIIEIMKNQSE